MSNPFAIVVADVEAVIARIKAGLDWFVREADLVIAWVDKEVPGAQQAIADLIQVGDQAMTALAGHAESGLGDIVAHVLDGAQTTALNALGATGLDLTSKKVLTADAVATVSNVKEIAHAAVDAAFAKVLISTHAAATGLSTANGSVAPNPSLTAAIPPPIIIARPVV